MTNGRSGAVEKKMYPSPLRNWHPFPPEKFQQPKKLSAPHPPLKNHTDIPPTPPPKKKKKNSQKGNLG